MPDADSVLVPEQQQQNGSQDPTEVCYFCHVMVRRDAKTRQWWHVVEVPGSSRTSATYLHCRTVVATPLSEVAKFGLAARLAEGPSDPEIQSVSHVARPSGIPVPGEAEEEMGR